SRDRRSFDFVKALTKSGITNIHNSNHHHHYINRKTIASDNNSNNNNNNNSNDDVIINEESSLDHCKETLKRKMTTNLISSSSSAATTTTTSSCLSKGIHIKKPLNAFMLFMKEMRSRVQEECTLKESAAINQVLGKKWHELTREEQTKYYEMARHEKELHQQLYPNWSARDNYAYHARRRKRRRQLFHKHGLHIRGTRHMNKSIMNTRSYEKSSSSSLLLLNDSTIMMDKSKVNTSLDK
ncbi:unnamed protein product, partial [Schistosoma margrebowiei]